MGKDGGASCEDCRFWLPLERHPNIGRCHRYPPQVYGSSRSSVAFESFPETGIKQWCGEFAARQDKERDDDG